MQRCVICGRLVDKPKLSIGGHAIGAKCAKKLGLTYDNRLKFKPMILQKAAEFENKTPDFFDETLL